MFAVIKTGGKQYKVSPGTLLKVERLEGEAGQSVHLSSVLLLNNEGTITVGAPLLDQVQVSATIVEQARADKIIVFKKKRRQGYRRKAGHRQDITVLRIEEILTAGKAHSDHKRHEAKLLRQLTTESSETTNAPSDIHISEAVKTPVVKKPKVKKEVDSSAVNSKAEAAATIETTHIAPDDATTTEIASTKLTENSAKEVSSEVSKPTDHDQETTTHKDKKKKPSSKSFDADHSESQ